MRCVTCREFRAACAECLATAREEGRREGYAHGRAVSDAQLKAEVEMLRGVGCEEDGDGPCGVCLKCREAKGYAACQADVVADLTNAANIVEGRHHSVFDGSIAQTLRDAAARYEAGRHVGTAKKEKL